MIFFLFLVFIFWSITVFKYTVFWIYLWQIKEYRYDRMKAHFELPSSRALIINKRTWWLIGLLMFSLVPMSFIQKITLFLALIFYGFFSARTVKYFKNKTLKFPKITLRVILIFFSTFSFYIAGLFIIFIYVNKFLLSFFILIDILTPAIAVLSILLTHPLSVFFKKRIIKKATRKREKMKQLLVIGVTGSYGKSSVKELVSLMLAEQFKVLKTPENINIDIGIAKVILKSLTKDCEVFVVEMGAYKKGELKKVTDMIKPQIGILTGINDQHISLFGNIKNTQEAKYELIDSLPEKGLAVFNGDNEYTKTLFRQCNKPKRLYSLSETLDKIYQPITVESIKEIINGFKIYAKEGEEEEILSIILPSKQILINVVGAVVVAREIGITYSEIKRALGKFKQSMHALNIKKGIKDTIIIDDSYSANLEGVLSALETLKNTKGRQKICILQPLIELGSSGERVHKKIGAEIAEACDWCIITSIDYFPIIYKEALENGMAKNAIMCIPNARDALRKTQELCDKEDVILLENRIPKSIISGLILN